MNPDITVPRWMQKIRMGSVYRSLLRVYELLNKPISWLNLRFRLGTVCIECDDILALKQEVVMCCTCNDYIQHEMYANMERDELHYLWMEEKYGYLRYDS